MKLHIIDIIIIVAYFLANIGIGVFFTRKAAKGMDSYFLAERRLPWYFLSVSHAAGMYDVTGTMWLVYLCFVYGLKSVWIPWIYPMFIHIFYMVYLAKWVRRSNVLTGAEWIRLRFGNDRGAELSYCSVIIWAIVSVIGFIGYDFKGIGKFAAVLFPWDFTPNTYAIIIMAIAAVCTILGGLYSVIVTALVQYGIITIASVIIGVIAMMKVSPGALDAIVPNGWKDIFFGWHLNLDWSGSIKTLNEQIQSDGWSLFSIFVGLMLFKGILVSSGMPAPNYDMQRLLATQNPKQSAMMSGLASPVVLIPRYFLITGITVLALAFYTPQLDAGGGSIDFETILPFVIKNFVPAGFMGLLLAGLIAAFMSTFASTLNAGIAYISNDIFKRYIFPNASNKTHMMITYLSSVGVLALGITFGFYVKSIGSVTQWIFAALWGGYTAANLLKWYWWRLNGYGYFSGMVVGTLAAIAMPLIFPELPALQAFPIIFILATIASVAVSLLTPPQDEEVVKKFYKQIRPWGLWGPIYQKVIREDPNFKKNREFKRDIFNIAIGIIWQTTLTAIPIYLVIKQFVPFSVAVVIVIITSFVLKKTWLDKLEEN